MGTSTGHGDLCVSSGDLSILGMCRSQKSSRAFLDKKKNPHFWSSLRKNHSKSGQQRWSFSSFFLFPNKKFTPKPPSPSFSRCFSRQFPWLPFHIHSLTSCLLLLAPGPGFVGNYNGASVPGVAAELPSTNSKSHRNPFIPLFF